MAFCWLFADFAVASFAAAVADFAVAVAAAVTPAGCLLILLLPKVDRKVRKW